MKILLINRTPPTLMTLPAEAVNVFNLYLTAETAVYCTALLDFFEYIDPKYKWSDDFVIELYYKFYNEQLDIDKGKLLKMWKEDIKIRAIKHKLKVHLIAIHRFRNLINFMKAALVKWHENFLKSFGIFPWADLFKTDDSYTIYNMFYMDDDQEEDTLIQIISDPLFKNDTLLMFSGNIGDFMTECALDNEKNNFTNDNPPDFYSFPLFNMPNKYPDKDHNIPGSETMMQIRKNLKEKTKPVWDILDSLEKDVRASDFETTARQIALNCCDAVKPACAALQKQIDNDLLLQQMKNASAITFNAELWAGVMKLGKVPEYFEKARILLPFVSNALKEKLSRMMDIDKGEVFLYCKVPRDIQEGFDEINKKPSTSEEGI